MAETPTTITLWRPVGRNELALIRDAESRRFPPRLDGQPIFYPVRNFEYAEQIARDWNSTDRRHAYVGYVTEFQVREDFLRRYEPHQVGARMHSEYWIPADELDLFNDAIIGPIEVVAEYRHGRRIESAPGESLPLDEARIDEIRESYRRLADDPMSGDKRTATRR